GKHRVHMCAQADGRVTGTGANAEHVCLVVGVDVTKAKFEKMFQKPLAACLLAEWGSGNASQFQVPSGQLLLVRQEPRECGPDFSEGHETRDFLLYCREKVRSLRA